MSEFRADLLIGGMALKNLVGMIEDEAAALEANWSGALMIDPLQNRYLASGRPYRLELEDGRAGKIVIERVDCVPGQRELRVVFAGLTSLAGRLQTPPRNESIDVSL